ncbi:hypothetical protein CHGG_04172 [Chaetomium globosum CBS 148.51]|uniref:Mitochondrial fission process protein 1 n=1 Tax=Chaetomium globosum (strain ATCC 6205 / CBS 148.51 / DSM 1962 / NBRC 6347 / NRRL 1970) TaxID=306901 RepID=Q2H224_CHAGB|nr:uncharacterized protein CHGG_04172 [Chaetomium globosum CBS 148.51]EAQ87553.1 hypothetical protein CHGG_04172 [Chaetomium globosum CBS 148.51]
MWPWSSSADKPVGSSTSQNEPESATKDVKKAAAEFDPSKLPDKQKLNPKLQKIMDKEDHEDNFFDELVDGYAPPSTDSNVRYAAYAARFRTILLSAHRYVAYTSDIGESFRPVAHPWLVRGAYGVSWAYILGDVSYEGYKAFLHNQRALNPRLELTARQQKILGLEEATPPPTAAAVKETAAPALGAGAGAVAPLDDYRTVMLQRGIFQSLASMVFSINRSRTRSSGRSIRGLRRMVVTRLWGMRCLLGGRGS